MPNKTIHLDGYLQIAISVYSELISLLQVTLKEMDAAVVPSSFWEDVLTRHRELSEKAAAADASVLSLLEEFSMPPQTELYAEWRRKMEETERYLCELCPKASALKSVLGAELSAVRDGQHAMQAYRSGRRGSVRLRDKC